MIFINESIYWHGTDRILNYLNRLLLEVLGCAPALILTVFFVKRKFPTVGRVTPKNYSIFYKEMKVYIVN